MPAAPPRAQAGAVDFQVVSKDVQQKLKDRDEAMKFACQSMFDCDGDRREFAHQQYIAFEKRMASKGQAQQPGGGVKEATAAAAEEPDK